MCGWNLEQLGSDQQGNHMILSITLHDPRRARALEVIWSLLLIDHHPFESGIRGREIGIILRVERAYLLRIKMYVIYLIVPYAPRGRIRLDRYPVWPWLLRATISPTAP